MKQFSGLRSMPRWLAASPWVVVACALVLAHLVIVLGIQRARKESDISASLYLERASSLFYAYEVTLRAGMGFGWTDSELQQVLDNLATAPDIHYMAVTNQEGMVLAANKPEMLGAQLLSPEEMGKLQPTNTIKAWNKPRLAGPAAPPAEIFLVYTLISDERNQERLRQHGHSMMNNHMRMMRERFQNAPAERQNLVVFIGYDLGPLLAAQKIDARQRIVNAVLLTFLALAGILSLFLVRGHQRLQAELRRQDRLAALGSMAAGVAHEIRNPLGAIKGLARFFQEVSPAESEEARIAGIMTQEVLRLDKVVGDLLELSRPDQLHPRSVELAPFFAHIVDMTQDEMQRSAIDFHLELPERCPPVMMDKDRMTQVFLNLFLNAIQAMPQGGRLILRVTPHSVAPRKIVFELSDTGQGIAPEHLPTIFSPYFTTKAQGTGLGLSLVQKIVEAHEGKISVSSRSGQGSTFILIMPLQAR